MWWLESVDRGRVSFNRFMRSQRYWTWCAKEITEVFVVGGTKPDEYVLCVGSGDGGIMNIKRGLHSPQKKKVYAASTSFATSYFYGGTSSHCSVCGLHCSSSYSNHDGINRNQRLSGLVPTLCCKTSKTPLDPYFAHCSSSISRSPAAPSRPSQGRERRRGTYRTAPSELRPARVT